MAEPGLHGDPFAALGLPARPGLSDEDVRAAWRRIAAATHPDREDGGDPARFGAAAAAYVTLRTDFGRGEALADLGEVAAAPARRPGRHRGQRGRGGQGGRERSERGRVRSDTVGRGSVMAGFRVGAGMAGSGARVGARVSQVVNAAAGIVGAGRGRGLLVRGMVAGAASTAAFLAVGWTPGTVGVLAGALSWLGIARLRP